MKNDYYVYHHVDEDGNLFYIGRGRDRRAYLTTNRNLKWKEYVSNKNFTVKFVAENLSYDKAEDLEVLEIEKHLNNGFLTNKLKTNLPHKILPITHRVRYDTTSKTFLVWADSQQLSSKSRVKVNHPAGCLTRGYATVSIDGKPYLNHRIIWVIHNQREIPRGYVINHIDCNPSNNAIDNLELVTYEENNQRKCVHKGKLASTNTSGYNAVRESKTSPNGRTVYLNATVTWYDNRPYSKSFSYLKYGKEKAWELALEFKANLDKELEKERNGNNI